MKRRLTPEEQELWRYVTRNDAPLQPQQPPPEPDLSVLAPQPQKTKPEIRKYKPGMHHPAAVMQEEVPLSPGDYTGIDRATAERFRKGNMPFDGTLDLHGLTRERAYEKLVQFMERHHKAGSRCLLVITGKGREGAGVLKGLVPRWLAEPTFKPLVLALDKAQARHGGSGAYYLLLRRRR